MKRAALVLMLGVAAPVLSGCVVALVPVLAGAAITGTQVKLRREAQARVAAAMPAAAARHAANAPPRDALPPAPVAVPPAPPVAALVVPSVPVASTGDDGGWSALADYLKRAAAAYRDKQPERQLVIVDGASLSAPYFEPCGAKPLAVIVDIDQTALADPSAEASAGADGWTGWERGGAAQVEAAPGAVAALAAARGAGIDVIFNTNRPSARADDTISALNVASLGPVEHYKTLWMRGDDGGGLDKDNRRWAIATGYCVVALIGDELGDFSDAFNVAATPAHRRTLAQAPVLKSLWGNGWFMLPNAVRGTASKGMQP